MTPQALKQVIDEIDDRTEGDGYHVILFLDSGISLTGGIYAIHVEKNFVQFDVHKVNGVSLLPIAELLPAWIETSKITAVMLEG